MRLLPIFGLILGGALAARSFAAPATEPTQLATISNPRLTEISGLAASRRYPGLIYAHNDSGDSARVFLLNAKGETVATVNLKGAYARDYEDIAVAGNEVFVGDIGDNLGLRDAVQIYRFIEPALDPQKLGQALEVKPEVIAFQYPGAPRDAETLLAAPGGKLWIVSKDENGSTLFAAPKRFQAGQTQLLKRVGDKIRFGATGIFTKLATGGEFSPDGTRLAVVTYAQLYEWKLPAPFDVSGLAKLKPSIRALPGLKQCESVCFSADGKRILVSSEGEGAPIWSFSTSQAPVAANIAANKPTTALQTPIGSVILNLNARKNHFAIGPTFGDISKARVGASARSYAPMMGNPSVQPSVQMSKIGGKTHFAIGPTFR